MKLIGKRVERLNSFGDSLAIKLKDEGQMRLSPALMSRLKVTADNNKIGFGYPENEGESLVIYKAEDGDGVAVNKQGYIKNIPHNRDLRSHMGLSNTGEEDMYVLEEELVVDGYPNYKFYQVTIKKDRLEEEEEGWDVDDSTVVEHDIQEKDTVENHTDDSQEAEETDNEEVTEEKKDDDSFDSFELY